MFQFSNDSDYLFIIITDITELLLNYWIVHLLPSISNLKYFSLYHL